MTNFLFLASSLGVALIFVIKVARGGVIQIYDPVINRYGNNNVDLDRTTGIYGHLLRTLPTPRTPVFQEQTVVPTVFPHSFIEFDPRLSAAPSPGGTCSDPPPFVEGASSSYYNRQMTSKNVEFVVYQCTLGRRMINGNGVIFCLPYHQWTKPPQCVMSLVDMSPVFGTSVTGPTMRHSRIEDCTNMDSINSSLCDTTIIAYRYNIVRNECVETDVCWETQMRGSANNVFASKNVCMNTCSNSRGLTGLL